LPGPEVKPSMDKVESAEAEMEFVVNILLNIGKYTFSRKFAQDL
jgi:hypothetical protein